MTLFCCFVVFSSAFLLADCQTAGGTIDSVGQSEINIALDKILDDTGLFDFTHIAIGVANIGNRRLVSPKWYIYSGDTDHAMPLVVDNGQTGLNLFSRKAASVFGTDGIVTYDIEGTPLCIAVMWSVVNLGSNRMNVKVYPQLTPDRTLYNQMKDIAGDWGADQWGVREEFGVRVAGSITTGRAVKQIIYVDSAGYDLGQGPEYHAWCDTSLIGRDYCVRECSPTGKCDTNVECVDDSYCDGSRLTCSGACN